MVRQHFWVIEDVSTTKNDTFASTMALWVQ